MKDLYFYFHAGSGNHGCEAIVRSTQALFQVKPILVSSAPEEDKCYHVDKITTLNGKRTPTPSILEKMGCVVTRRFLKSEAYGYRVRAKYEVADAPLDAIACSIGGDNYCYGDAYNLYLESLNRQLHKRGIKTVLWGCSIEPQMVTEAMKKDFARYDLIVARESISYRLLKECNSNTIFACDPAFTLHKEILPLPEGFIPGKTIGINLSPLIQKNEQRKGITFENYHKLIQYILDNTDYSVALIPHVVSPGNDDREAMQPLLYEYRSTERVFMIEDCNCEQLKGYIARCKLFIGARTHATIAAYSTCVPTLVIGYSTKATGIARDLFGTDENYVLPVQKLERADDMILAFNWLQQNADNIKKHLIKIMPKYMETSRLAVEAVQQL